MIFIIKILNYLTLLADILIGLTVIGLILESVLKKSTLKTYLSSVKNKIGRQGILYAFILTLTATLGSLFFSEVIGFEPCKLCWFQRIFMYPLPLLFLISLIRKEKQIAFYGLVMSVVGSLIAAYHYFLQVGQMYNLNLEKFTNCSIVGYSPGCTSYFILNLGYITIPVMSLSVFVFVSLLLFVVLKVKQ